jgi:2-keto-4-pentenoate hydratase/2-oxohepta-3-ene-1,7-dioic acid hydratase in catechol pathway
MEITLPTSQHVVRPGKVLCIGRNYARHAAEMKSEVPEQPMIFLKPSTALLAHGGAVILPEVSQDVHHEVELVAVIGRGGKRIPAADALDYVDGYAVGLDMTARDIQSVAKAKGHPWSVAKGFDTFAPLGGFVAAGDVADPQMLDIELTIDGELRQSGRTRDMIFSVAYLVAYCSRIFTLEPGDLIYTGTPEGVGPVQVGNVLEATVTGLPRLQVSVESESAPIP